MSEPDPIAEVALWGPFAVIARDGTNLTPKSARARALIALLMLTPERRRARRWIEGKLWSTREPEQASASLRQCLTDIRRSLGPHRDLLLSDRREVALAPGIVAREIGADGPGPDRDLLEGLEINDPAWADWLRVQRNRALGGPDLPPGPETGGGIMIRVGALDAPGTSEAMEGDFLADQVGQTISEQLRAWCQSSAHANALAGGDPDLEVSCKVAEDGPLKVVFIRIVHAVTGQVLFSKMCRLEDPPADLLAAPALAQTIFEAAETVLGKLPLAAGVDRPEIRASALARMAVHKLFAFRPESLAEADRLFDEAFGLDANGAYLAWRALIQTAFRIERIDPDGDAVCEAAEALTARALEIAPHNPQVLALVAQTRMMLFGDGETALGLAERALAGNPTNAFAWQTVAQAMMQTGAHGAAYAASARGRQIARQSQFRYWWDTNHCIVCIATDRFAEATEAAEAAIRVGPGFRPAHRHLLALHARDGREADARAVASRLAALEDGFSVERMVLDSSYPVRTMRTHGLLRHPGEMFGV